MALSPTLRDQLFRAPLLNRRPLVPIAINIACRDDVAPRAVRLLDKAGKNKIKVSAFGSGV